MRYESFKITRFEIVDGKPRMQIESIFESEPKFYEAFLTISRNQVDNRLSLDVGRHYLDRSSTPWFENSSCWPEDKLTKRLT